MRKRFFLIIILLAVNGLIQPTISLADNKPERENQRPNRPPPQRPGQPQQPGAPPPPHTKPQPPPPPPKKVIRQSDIARVAEGAGADFADVRLRTYGVGYQLRFNFREGLLDQKNNLGDYDRSEVVRNSPAYRQSTTDGQASGQQNGVAAGLADARQTAASYALSDINSAIDTAINNETPLVMNPQVHSYPYSGAQVNMVRPRGFTDELTNLQGTVYRQLEGLLNGPGDDSLLRRLWDVRDMASSHDLSIPSSIQEYDSFRDWRYDRSTDRDYRSRSAREFLREITGPDYEHPTENEATFRRAFEYSYGRVLRYEWPLVVQRHNSAARQVGQNTYQDASYTYARKLGFFDGYASEYSEASKTNFRLSVQKFYDEQFALNKSEVENRSEITRIKTDIVNYNSGTVDATAGDILNVVVSTAENRGQQNGELEIAIAESEYLNPLRAERLVLDGIKRLKEPASFLYLAQIKKIDSPDQKIPVSVRVGTQTFQHTLSIRFEQLIIRASQLTDNVAYAQFLLKQAAGWMKAEYDDKSGLHDQYVERRPDLLIVRMLNTFQNLNDEQKNNLRAQGQFIRDAFGEKPIRISPKRNDWEEVQKMIEQEMKLQGKRPGS